MNVGNVCPGALLKQESNSIEDLAEYLEHILLYMYFDRPLDGLLLVGSGGVRTFCRGCQIQETYFPLLAIFLIGYFP